MSIGGQRTPTIERSSLADELLVNYQGNTTRLPIQKFAVQLANTPEISALGDAKQLYPTRADLPAASGQNVSFSAVVFQDADGDNNGTWTVQLVSGVKTWVWAYGIKQDQIVATDVGAGTANAIMATTRQAVVEETTVIMNVFRTNTGTPVTVKFNDQAPLTLKTISGLDPVAGGVRAGSSFMAIVRGDELRMLSDEAVSDLLYAARDATFSARDRAQDWAEKATDTPVASGEFSAKHHATKAGQSASQALANKDASAISASLASASEGAAKVYAETIGPFAKTFNTRAALTANGITGIAADAYALVLVDETRGNNRTIYQNQAGTMVFIRGAGLDVDDDFLPTYTSKRRVVRNKLEDAVHIFDFIPAGQHTTIETSSSSYDMTADLNDAITAANGKPIRFRPGRYNVDVISRSIPAGGLRMIGEGSVIRGTNETSIGIQLDGAISTSYEVTSISNDDFIYDGAAMPSRVTKLTLTSVGADVVPGAVMKLFSDDEIANARPGTETSKRRRGEFVVVVDVTGTVVTLSSVVEDSYTTNVKVVVVRDRPFLMEGFRIEQSAAAEGSNSPLSFIRLRGLFRPIFRSIDISGVRSTGIQLMGAFQPRIENLRCIRLTGNTLDGQYGYMIDDIACEGGSYSNLAGAFVRHVYTTNTFPVNETADDFTKSVFCGKTRHARVVNSHGLGCFNSPFDVHEESQDVGFIGCATSMTIEGRESQGSGYNFRSQSCFMIGCTSDRDQIGVTVHEAYNNSTLGGAVTISDCIVTNAQQFGIEIRNYGSGNRVRGVRIEGGSVESRGPALDMLNADITVIGTMFRSEADVAIKQKGACNVTLRRVEAVSEVAKAVESLGSTSMTIDGGRFEGASGVFFASGHAVSFENPPFFVLKGATNSIGVIDLGAGASLKAPRGFMADISGSTGTNARVVRATGDGVSVSANFVHVLRGSASYIGLFDGANYTGHLSVQFRNVSIDGNGVGTTEMINIAGSLVPRVQRRADDRTTAAISVTFTAAAPTPSIVDVGRIDDDEFTLFADIQGTGQSYTMPDFPPGRNGQRMNVVCAQTSGSGNTIALAHLGTTNRRNRGATTVTLVGNNFDATSYVFIFGNWRQV